MGDERFSDLPQLTALTGKELMLVASVGGVVSAVPTSAMAPVVFPPTVVNLRQLGVTASTSARFNTDAILTAINLAGPQGTMVVPNWGLNPQGTLALPTNHLGFTIPGTIKNGNLDVNAGLTITGENSYWLNPNAGAWLQCIDNTALGIGLQNGAVGFNLSNLRISGGFFGVRTGPAGSPQFSGFSFTNLHFFGPFGRSALAFAGHNEHGRVSNCYFEYNGTTPNYAIEWLNEPQGNSALVDTLFEFTWIYGNWKVPVYLVNENPQQTLQGVEFRRLRTTQQQYCSVAIRAPCQGVVFSDGAGGGESGNILVPSGSRVDLFVDTNTYGAPAAMNGVSLTLKGTNSNLGSPDFPILNRGTTLVLDLEPGSSPINKGVGNVTNSVGITTVINDMNINSGAIVTGIDPSAGVDSHSTAYLGNLGSNQPIFDYWPRGPMYDETAQYLFSMEDTDEEDDLYLLLS